jgi:Tfp pilus assembly protein PilE
MNKLSKNESGFSVVELLLALILLVVIGGVGYMVYHNDHNTNKTNNTAVKTASSPSSTTASQSNLKQYTYNGISFSYPKSWTLKTFSTQLGDELSLSSIPGFDEATTQTLNNPQYYNNDALTIQEWGSDSANIVEPFGAGSFLVSNGLQLNGSSNNCVVGYGDTGQTAPYGLSNLENIEILNSCDSSKGEGNGEFTNKTGNYFGLNIEKVSQSYDNKTPLSTTSSDYQTIMSIIQSMKY